MDLNCHYPLKEFEKNVNKKSVYLNRNVIWVFIFKCRYSAIPIVFDKIKTLNP